MEVISRSNKRHPMRGLLAGAAAGLVSAWAMNQFQAAWSKASEHLKSGEQESQSQNNRPQGQEQKEDATMKAAGKLAQAALGRDLSKQEKKKAGPAVHYLFGTFAGAVYGLIGEYLPLARVGFGTVFGATLFLLADELAVPALGLSGSATEAPLSSHLYGLSSHLVYGASAEGIRRGIEKAA
jgi:putative membrane protein